MRRRALALALVALGLAALPGATALDLLPSEARLGEHEARILVRSALGEVHVRADPPVRVGVAAPGAEPMQLALAPATLPARHVWRGIDGIAEVVLVRDDPARAVAIELDDGARTGVAVEWPAATKPLPLAFPALACVAAALLRRRP